MAKTQERDAIIRLCLKTNMVIYSSEQCSDNKEMVRELGSQFGLLTLDQNLYADDDGISALHVVPKGRRNEYIPYSNKPINWHTDGYYNPPAQKIQSMVLHCVSPAPRGGENALLDHEIVYMLMREENREYIKALMQPDAMTIPANIENGREIRPEQSGPVFSVDPQTGDLHMRYTARTRSIQWKQDTITLAAVRFLEDLLSSDTPYIFRHKLAPGQGVFCNNVLHNRLGFENDPTTGQERMIFRARYYERIAGTSLLDYVSGK
jgi:alpha-ketoglutarate-dependent taurine dioxygenase